MPHTPTEPAAVFAVDYADYHADHVNSWRIQHGQPKIHPSTLPGHGAVAVFEGLYAGYAGAYVAPTAGGGKVAIIEWVVTRPGLAPAESRAVLSHAILHLCDRLYHQGATHALAHVPEALARAAGRVGFQTMQEGQKTIPMAVLLSNLHPPA